MFPQSAQAGPQTNNGYTTSAPLQQGNSLLGNPQIQANASQPIPAMNNTAPASSTTNPQVASMIKALKG